MGDDFDMQCILANEHAQGAGSYEFPCPVCGLQDQLTQADVDMHRQCAECDAREAY